MQLTTVAAFVAAFAAGASAHMEVIDRLYFQHFSCPCIDVTVSVYPSAPVLRGKTNPKATNVDFNMVAPLNQDGSNFPCKGYLSDLTGPSGEPSATYAAGQQAIFKTKGVEAAHNGGSCQVSLSFDQGATWKVIKSFIGNCVRSAGGNVFDQNQDYSFTIPADAKAGNALWAWSWFNQSGNREMYMNCAAITITGSGTSTLNNLPDMFVANVNKGCSTTEGTDVEFPNPGADVERNPAKNGAPTGPPTGTCAAASGAPAPAPAPAPAASSASAPAASSASAPAASASASASAPASASASASASAAPAPGAAGLTHTVATGELCSTIAQANGITTAALLAANPSVNAGCSNLRVGQVLNLRRRSRIMREVV